MRSLFFVSVVCCIFTGITSTAVAQKLKNSVSTNYGITNKSTTRFIEDIEIKAATNLLETPVNEISVKSSQVNNPSKEPISGTVVAASTIEVASSLQFKYAQLLNRNVEYIKNISLYKFIEEWWGTHYRYGGTGKNGIDCSALTGLLMGTVFAIKLPRTAREQYNESEKISKEDMQEADLVFFNTRGGVSHVGVYLGDGYFVHSSTSNGVMISSLNDPYYEKRFIGGGRVLNYAGGQTAVTVSE